MADLKISQLTAKTSLTGAEEFPINDGGTTKKATVGLIVPAFHGCKVYHSTTASTTSGVDMQPPFDSEEFDTDSYHDTVTNNTRITIPTGLGGYYELGCFISFQGNATNNRHARFRLNGTTIVRGSGPYITGSSNGTWIQSIVVLSLAAADYVEVNVFQNSGSTILIGGPNGYDTSAFWAYRVGV